jgi:hypothetical protein
LPSRQHVQSRELRVWVITEQLNLHHRQNRQRNPVWRRGRCSPRGMEPLWSPVVATGGNQRQIGRARKRRKQGKTVAVRRDRLPREVHGKEGVSGSSPEQGSEFILLRRFFCCRERRRSAAAASIRRRVKRTLAKGRGLLGTHWSTGSGGVLEDHPGDGLPVSSCDAVTGSLER